MSESCHTYEWMSHTCFTHELRITMSYEWVTNELRMSYEWVTNELRMYVIWPSEPCSTYTWVTYELRITMSYEWVSSRVRIHVMWLICDVTDLYVESFICYTCTSYTQSVCMSHELCLHMLYMHLVSTECVYESRTMFTYVIHVIWLHVTPCSINESRHIYDKWVTSHIW